MFDKEVKKISLLNYKYSVKLIIGVVKKYKKNNKIMIYLKKIIKKLDKHIEDKNVRKHKKLKDRN